jgi:drug/metabolite transporter (DMT)-like permease
VFGDRLTGRQWAGVAAAGLAVALLLVHEFTRLSGAPGAAAAVLLAACVWAYGTHRMRRHTLTVPTLVAAFWMTVATGLVVALAAVLVEAQRWRWPSTATQVAIVYNAVGVFAFAQVVWLVLARSLPPVASSISVMMIPVLGVMAGAVGLGEALHWQDFAAVGLIMGAIAAVLVPRRG